MALEHVKLLDDFNLSIALLEDREATCKVAEAPGGNAIGM